MPKPPRPEELFAFEMLRRVLHAEVLATDDNTKPGHHDGEVVYQDGRRAAVEVTTLAHQPALELLAIRPEIAVPGTEGLWELRYTEVVQIRDVRRHVPALIHGCDALGLDDLAHLPVDADTLAALRWAHHAEITLHRCRGTKRTGIVRLLPSGSGGFVDERLVGLGPWIESQRDAPWIRENTEKLARSGLPELHLVVRVHDSGMPFELWYQLIDDDEDDEPIDTLGPVGLHPLTHLWLLPAYGSLVTRWSARDGWARLPY